MQEIKQEIQSVTTKVGHALYGAIKKLLDEVSRATSVRDETLASRLHSLHEQFTDLKAETADLAKKNPRYPRNTTGAAG